MSATKSGASSSHSQASTSPCLPCRRLRSSPIDCNPWSRREAATLSTSLQRSASQNPYFLKVFDASARRRNSKRRRARKFALYCASWNTSQSGKSSSKIRCIICFTRETATKPIPACCAVFLLKRMRTRDKVIPCAFQCVRAQAKVKGNCLRWMFSSEAACTVALRIGTHFNERSLPLLSNPSFKPGKKVRGTTFFRPCSSTSSVSSLPRSMSSNSTITLNGACFSESLALGSPPSGQTKPRT